MTAKTLALIPLALVAALVAGCSPAGVTLTTEPAAAQPEPVVQTAEPTPSASTYLLASQLAADVEIYGGTRCTRWIPVPDPTSALDLGSCWVAGQELVIAIFATHTDASQDPVVKAELLKDVADTIVLVGQNWTVSCDEVDICQQVQEQLGGDLEVIPA